MSIQYVTVDFIMATSGKVVPIRIPVTSSVMSALSASGFSVSTALSLYKLVKAWKGFKAAQQAAIDAGKADGSWQNAFDEAFEENAPDEIDFLSVDDLGSDTAEEAFAAAVEAASEAADEVAADTAEVPYVDIGTGLIAVILAIISASISLDQMVKSRNRTTLVFHNMVPNTYLLVRPTVKRGSWFPQTNGGGDIISGSDTDSGIARIKIIATEDKGGTASFSMEPTGIRCEGDLVVELRQKDTDAQIAVWRGYFNNPISKRVEKSTYSIGKISGAGNYSAIEPITRVAISDGTSKNGFKIIRPSPDERRINQLHDVVIFTFTETDQPLDSTRSQVAMTKDTLSDGRRRPRRLRDRARRG